MSTVSRLALVLAAALALTTHAVAVQKLGPYFPMPAELAVTGNARETLLRMTADWLKTGLQNLDKAQQQTSDALEAAKGANGKPEDISALETKLKSLDADIAATKEDIALATDEKDLSKERQRERKRLMILVVDQWINEIGRQATQQLKRALLLDGKEAEIAENRHIQLSEQADALERAKHDVSIENWVISR
ncbi:MAG TPA: hypothetical protein VK446_08980 [Methylocystis sp.]|nr:hypothetical protein [Methylocystis sp.]